MTTWLHSIDWDYLGIKLVKPIGAWFGLSIICMWGWAVGRGFRGTQEHFAIATLKAVGVALAPAPIRGLVVHEETSVIDLRTRIWTARQMAEKVTAGIGAFLTWAIPALVGLCLGAFAEWKKGD
jgi:hypothetical protein